MDDTSATISVTLPAPTDLSSWPQDGANPAHLVGRIAAQNHLTRAWSADIGRGGGYREKILARPVIDAGIVYAMDSQAVVSAFDLANGHRRWRAESTRDEDDNTNVGGGLGIAGSTLYAVNGLAELVAFDVRDGRVRWRSQIGAPARSAPLIVDGRLFLITLGDKLIALSGETGQQIWSHTATNAATTMLGQPAPAFADGLVVAGFGSGELVALRADTGALAWTDSLASARGPSSVVDISAVRGMPVIGEGRVYAISVGGILVALDLRSGRRLWERDVAGADSPWVAGDWMFLISSDQQVAALHCQDGRVAWVSDLPRWNDEETQSDPIFWFGPLLTGERLIAAGTNGRVLSVSPYTGEILQRQKIAGGAALGPVAAQDTVLVVTDSGELIALR